VSKNGLPPLAEAEYNRLRDDIKERGILEPIVVDQGGTIIDGTTRAQIGAELGIDVPRRVVEVTDPKEREAMGLSLNVNRRHLERKEWTRWVLRIAELRGTPLGSKGGRPDGNGNPATVAGLAKEVGVSERTLRDRVQVFEGRKAPRPKAGRTVEVDDAKYLQRESVQAIIDKNRDKAERYRKLSLVPHKHMGEWCPACLNEGQRREAAQVAEDLGTLGAA
jgi:hypothetical protein